MARLPLTDGKTYARQVLKAPRRIVAQWVFNRADFLALMLTLGYEPILSVDHDLPIDHAGAPGPSVIGSMVFAPRR